MSRRPGHQPREEPWARLGQGRPQFLHLLRRQPCPPSGPSVCTRPTLTEGWLPFSHLNLRFSFPESLSQSFSSQTLYSFISFLSFVELQPENSGFTVTVSHLWITPPGLATQELVSCLTKATHDTGQCQGSRVRICHRGGKAARKSPSQQGRGEPRSTHPSTRTPLCQVPRPTVAPGLHKELL